MDRGAWLTIVHGVAKSQTWLSMHAEKVCPEDLNRQPEWKDPFPNVGEHYPICWGLQQNKKKKKKKNLRKGKFSFFLSWVLPPLRPQTSALLVRRPSHSDGDLPIGFSNSQAFRPGLSLHCLLSWTSSLLIACQETSQPLYSCKSILMDSFLCVCICPIGCVSLEKPNTDIPKLRKCTPLQYSCLENPMDRVACVHGVAKSWTRLSNFT